LRAAQLRGKKVVLIDDVMTSGASLHTAARVLREAGATQVSALVLARTEAGSDASRPMHNTGHVPYRPG
jgi:predicted amidophosphoribosyltransferase